MFDMKKTKIKNFIKGIKGKIAPKMWMVLGIIVILSLGGIFIQGSHQENQMDQENNETIVSTEEKFSEDIIQDVETIPTLASEEEVLEDELENFEAQSDMVMNWPGQGEVITEYGFGYSETFHDYRFHSGIDIALPHGYEVQAALPGTVERISENPWWGYEIVIKHGADLETVYKGIKPMEEEAGYQVAKGEIIGLVLPQIKYEGTMKPHVHFEIHQSGKAINPREKLK